LIEETVEETDKVRKLLTCTRWSFLQHWRLPRNRAFILCKFYSFTV